MGKRRSGCLGRDPNGGRFVAVGGAVALEIFDTDPAADEGIDGVLESLE
jgi:hypothetical protein